MQALEFEDDDGFDDDTGYDPDVGPDATEWLALSETERMEPVRSWHRARRVELPNPRLHALAHTVIESQIAEQVPRGPRQLRRLRSEGLTRHDAIHAIGMALTEEILPVLRGDPGERDLNAAYNERLKRLTAAEWRRLAEDDGQDG